MIRLLLFMAWRWRCVIRGWKRGRFKYSFIRNPRCPDWMGDVMLDVWQSMRWERGDDGFVRPVGPK